MPLPLTRRSSVVLLAVASAACAGSPREPAAPTPASAATPVAAPPIHTPAAANGGAAHPWTKADVQFMTGMIGHHAQAITMSRLAPSRAASPSVRTLAARIISSQEDEITTMVQWLRERGLPTPDPAHAAMDHHDHAGGAQMAGMLTADQMRQLERARGAEFDRLFLALMIQHHRGAVSMVSQLFGSYGAAQDETVFKFASDVNVDQTTEIARMQKMLAELTFGPS